MAKKYYAIRKGHKTGVFYDEWEIVKTYVNGFKNAEYKGFISESDANDFYNTKIDEVVDHDSYDIHIYCDGSYFKTSPNQFQSGAVFVNEEKVFYEISTKYINAEFAKSRNVAGEVLAIVESLIYCQKNNIKKVLFFVDYLGLIAWWNGSWKAEGIVAKYFLNQLKKFNDIEYNFVKVPAHTGNKYNDVADELAKKGLNTVEVPNV